MISRAEGRFAAGLAAWVRWVTRRPRAVAGALLLATAALIPWTAANLGVNSDNLRLLSKQLPFRQRYDELARLFPSSANALLVLVDGAAPARTREVAEALAARLASDPERFHEVYLAGSGPFFEREALLYRSPEELEELVDALARAQPLLAALEQQPRLATLASVLERGLDHPEARGVDWSPFLNRLGEVMVRVSADVPVDVSWVDLLLRGSAFEPPVRRVILVDPVLDFDSPLAARKPIRAIREAAHQLGAGQAVRVRITGNPALNYEEMRGLVWDVGVSSLASFLLVVALLQLALRSPQLVAAAATTLLTGLVWTSAFAAAAIGELNLISMAFAVLFIGLGIDFSIHLLLHYAELRRHGATPSRALEAAVHRVGTSLVLCAVTTAIGFYAFLPTRYLGVAELGLIAGTGMLVILALTLTLLPALVEMGWASAARTSRRLTGLARPARLPGRPLPVCAAFLALGLASLLAVPRLRFDPDVLHLRNPHTESVRAFEDLLADARGAAPWQADVVAADLAEAHALAARLARIPEVARAITLADHVPSQQEEKREILAEAALLLAPQSAGSEPPAPAPADPLAALRQLEQAVAEAEPGAAGRLAASMRLFRASLAEFLARAEGDGNASEEVQALERLLLGEFRQQLARLRLALDPAPVAIGDLPPALMRRLLAADGRARVQILPRENLGAGDALRRFVDAVLAEVPQATGSAVNLVEFGRATVQALRQALLSALAAIALLVWLLWRRASDALYVLAPLVLGSLLTAGVVVGLDLSFNFANVIVLPLLLGMGVDSGIHIVHRWRAGEAEGADDATTARGVLYSGLTTIASFGSLAFSSHRGIASLGLLLTLAMLLALACNLVFLPSLLALRRPRGAREASGAG